MAQAPVVPFARPARAVPALAPPSLQSASGATIRLARAAGRALDAVLALALLVLSAPLWLLAAVAVRTTPGPVLQRRCCVGERWRGYVHLSFRTRACAAPPAQPKRTPGLRPVPAPCRTAVGRFLEWSGIHELPALVNVLRGEISLFGPRPVTPAEFRALPRGEQRRRFQMAPGLVVRRTPGFVTSAERSGPAVGF